MASYKGHIAGGVIAYVLFILTLTFLVGSPPNWNDGPVYLSLVLMGALFPDVDTNSKAQRWFYSIFLILDIGLILNSRYAYAAFLGLFAMLPIAARHRGWTHSIWAMILIPAPIILLPYALLKTDPKPLISFYLSAVAGYGSHLAIDRSF